MDGALVLAQRRAQCKSRHLRIIANLPATGSRTKPDAAPRARQAKSSRSQLRRHLGIKKGSRCAWGAINDQQCRNIHVNQYATRSLDTSLSYEITMRPLVLRIIVLTSLVVPAVAFAPSLKPAALIVGSKPTCLAASTLERERGKHDMFTVSRGPEEWDAEHHPHHHLVDADHEKLHDITDHPISQLNVNVHEMDLDAVTITALCFAAIAINFMLFAHVDSGLGGFVASLQNTFRQ